MSTPQPIPARPTESGPLPRDAATLIDVLDWHVAQHGDREHIRFLAGDDDVQPLTYAALRSGAAEVAAGLRARAKIGFRVRLGETRRALRIRFAAIAQRPFRVLRTRAPRNRSVVRAYREAPRARAEIVERRLPHLAARAQRWQNMNRLPFAAALLLTSIATAQTFPTKPVRIVKIGRAHV